ncbi:MAG: tRNA 2-thiouridine(34) synthase MnmA [Candidatus Dormibacteria bacterium]
MVAVAMSGGVDSSVAAALCSDRGIPTLGITLAMWPRTEEMVRDRGCCSVDSVEDARRVAARLGIPHHAWNLEAEFNEKVIAGFDAEYAAGRTPNPCVHCNQRIKFGVLLDRARRVGATHVATGHYARIQRRDGRWTLHRAVDARKDQAYTLHRLDQEQLGHAVLPLGTMPSKRAVREEARTRGLATAAKPDSQELCFVDGGMRDALRQRLAGRYSPGPIVDGAGARLGEHEGLPFYTVGQRGGLGCRVNRPDARPLYVVDLDRRTNTVVVGPREALQRSLVVAEDIRWVAGRAPVSPHRCQAQLRAHGAAHPVVVSVAGAGLRLTFDPPVSQVSPGQSVVLYEGDEVLGGGIVRSAN